MWLYTLAVHGGGAGIALYAVLYVRIGVYLGLEFAPRTVATHLGIAAVTAVTGGAVLASGCTPSASLTIGLTTVVSTGSATIVAGYLSAKIKSLAAKDPLTGLANRRVLDGWRPVRWWK